MEGEGQELHAEGHEDVPVHDGHVGNLGELRRHHAPEVDGREDDQKVEAEAVAPVDDLGPGPDIYEDQRELDGHDVEEVVEVRSGRQGQG
jgi:hypothetical protein